MVDANQLESRSPWRNKDAKFELDLSHRPRKGRPHGAVRQCFLGEVEAGFGCFDPSNSAIQFDAGLVQRLLAGSGLTVQTLGPFEVDLSEMEPCSRLCEIRSGLVVLSAGYGWVQSREERALFNLRAQVYR